MPLFGELFVSEILKKHVLDPRGDEIGRLKDIIVVKGKDLPTVSALILQHKNVLYRLEWESVGIFNKRIISSRLYAQKIRPYTPLDDDLMIVRDILDKQIVDANGVKVVRVNDVKLEGINNKACLVAVDVGIRGLLRRLGIEHESANIYRIFGKALPYNLIPWNYIQPLEPRLTTISLTVPRQMLSALHPADIAELMNKIPHEQALALFKGLDPNTAAETIHELESHVKKSIVEALDKEYTLEIVERMPPDEAVDLVSELESEKAKEILESLKKDEAEEIQELLAHEEDTAGGLMTTQFIAYPPHLKVGEVIERFKMDAHGIETVYYIYVIDENKRLIGVTSLRDILLSSPTLPLSSIMEAKLKTVTPDEDEDVIAEMLSKYNLLALPVIDSDGELLGIVTIDDIIDRILPPEAKRKRRKM
ncbi:MAG: CBS domain-containing protein [Thermodesulfovibrionia bacterium]